MRLKVIGNRERFSAKLLKAIDEAEAIACEGEATLCIAADYGGRWDIAQAVKQIALKVSAGELAVEDISEQSISDGISTANLPPLDLLIRTGGETRISNFLLWQAAYAELFFSPVLWPEFGPEALMQAVDCFHGRERRYGKTSEQLAQEENRA